MIGTLKTIQCTDWKDEPITYYEMDLKFCATVHFTHFVAYPICKALLAFPFYTEVGVVVVMVLEFNVHFIVGNG